MLYRFTDVRDARGHIVTWQVWREDEDIVIANVGSRREARNIAYRLNSAQRSIDLLCRHLAPNIDDTNPLLMAM